MDGGMGGGMAGVVIGGGGGWEVWAVGWGWTSLG